MKKLLSDAIIKLQNIPVDMLFITVNFESKTQFLGDSLANSNDWVIKPNDYVCPQRENFVSLQVHES